MSTDPFQTAPPPVDPADALADLEADFDARTALPEVVVVEDTPPPVGRSWSFEFPRERFRRGRGNSPLSTHGDATLIQWAEKCLRTTRGAHPIHPPGYGLAHRNNLLGRALAGAPIAELEERIRDALTFNPKIADIRDFAYEIDPDDEGVAVAFTMVRGDGTTLSLSTTLSASREF